MREITMAENLVNEGDILSRVQKYELDRGRDRLYIDVHEIMFPDEPKYKFVAELNLILQSTSNEYLGYGETEQEALDDCLRKIKNVSNDMLFSKP